MPYQPARSVSGRKIVVTTVRNFASLVLPDADLRLIQLPDHNRYSRRPSASSRRRWALARRGAPRRERAARRRGLQTCPQLRAIARQRRYLLRARRLPSGWRSAAASVSASVSSASASASSASTASVSGGNSAASAAGIRPPSAAARQGRQHALHEVALVAKQQIPFPEGEVKLPALRFTAPTSAAPLRASATVTRLRRQAGARRSRWAASSSAGANRHTSPRPRQRALAAKPPSVPYRRIAFLLAPLWYHAAAPLSMRVSFAEKQHPPHTFNLRFVDARPRPRYNNIPGTVGGRQTHNGTIVCKFGSSLADASSFQKAKNILLADEKRLRRASAPGRHTDGDDKVTDLLYAATSRWGKNEDAGRSPSTGRCAGIARRLKPGPGRRFGAHPPPRERVRTPDFAASRSGEYLSSVLLTNYLGWDFIDAADVVRFDKQGAAAGGPTACSPRELKKRERAVIQHYGAFRMAACAFSRGSDISGAGGPRRRGPELYENWTDVSGFSVADPRVIKNPAGIERLTYRRTARTFLYGRDRLHGRYLPRAQGRHSHQHPQHQRSQSPRR